MRKNGLQMNCGLLSSPDINNRFLKVAWKPFIFKAAEFPELAQSALSETLVMRKLLRLNRRATCRKHN